MKLTTVLCVLVVAIMVVATSVLAQDAMKAAPQSFKERLNNDRVRVLEYSSKPGDKEAMHSHPAILIYVIQGGKLRSTTADGKSTDSEYKAGDVRWREAITHTGENIGTTELKALLVEVKQGKKK